MNRAGEKMPIEVELKFHTKDMDKIKRKLDSLGCEWFLQKEQSDRIYYMPMIDPTLFWRIRDEKDKAILSVKKLLNTKSAIELETYISDANSVQMMMELSGFEEYAFVKKQRTEGILNGYKICLDVVSNLGYFIEIETLAAEEKNKEILEEQLKRFAETLGLSSDDICKERYHTMLHKKTHKGLC